MDLSRFFRSRIVLSLALICSLGFARAEQHATQRADIRIVKGLKFSEADASLTLDLYLPMVTGPTVTGPKAISEKIPCVMTIQGGGFRAQDGQRFKNVAEHLVEHGFAAALISYRGRPTHKYRDTIADVKDSVRFIRRVSNRYNIDPARIGATGRSAGGTLAALLAVTGDSDDPDSHIQAAVCFAGVFDFVGRFTDTEQLDLQPRHKTKMTTNGEWIGTPFSPTDTDWLSASAITHVDAKDPPTLFLHSRDDATVPWIQSRDMHRAMTKAGTSSEIRIFETGGHGVRPKDENSLVAMTVFFRKHL